MDRRIASAEIAKDPAAKALLNNLDSLSKALGIEDSIFYYNFPIFRDESNQLYRSKVLFASRCHGLIIFACVADIARDSSNLEKADKELTQLDTILYGKFLRSNILRRNKREIFLNIHSAIYFFNSSENLGDIYNESIVLKNEKDLESFINETKTINLSEKQWEELTSLIEGTKAISRQDERDKSNLKDNSKAMALAKIEDKIATFDVEQRHAAISIVEGPQRIRGIAGSGKTIVLAMRVAHIHLSKPNAIILLTFWTKSLYDMLKQIVTRFYRQFDDKDPDWDKIHILHAWGGQSTEGVYFNSCIENGIRPLALKEIASRAGKSKFDYACNELLSIPTINQKYDYILIDEGQDLPASFYKLCFRLCKGKELDRNIIWAYDELQTIMDVRPQDVRATFGVNKKRVPLINLDRASKNISKGLLSHDIVLKKSYRNPPEILMSAHALGLGIYSKQPVQILEDKKHWEDLGYEVIEGNCVPGEKTVITRPQENSPLNISEYTTKDDIIKMESFASLGDEIVWVISEIESFLEEGLYPHDILIISLDDRNSKTYFSYLGEELSKKNISMHNLQNSYYSVPKFFVEDHITVSSVYKAKGNEAAVVMIVGIDALGISLGTRSVRNKVFTAFTRSRAWLRISGLKPGTSSLKEELNLVLANYPFFKFIYPNPDQIQTIQRDLSANSVKVQEIQQLILDLNLTDDDIESLVNTAKKK